jgi:FAD/FMN-containing dehydrogenase
LRAATKEETMATVSANALDSLRTDFTGDLLVAGDAGYDDARALWNGDHDRRPALIARASRAEDVAAAIAFARDHALEIAVRGGGHSFAGHGVLDDGLMIDLSPMNTVTVDPGTQRARCGGGTTWAELDASTQEHGLAVPGGVVSHTGVGGLTLGGGIGWLSRKHGLSCDNLVGARVVTADGNVVSTSATENADLHWALRGGGGNFGVVTEFEFQLHSVGPMVNAGLFFWGVESGAEAVGHMREVIAGLPADAGAQIIGVNAPPLPFIAEEHHGKPGYMLAIVGWGSPEEHAAMIAPAREGLAPRFEFVTPIPYTMLQQMIDDSAPWGILAYEKACYLDELTDDAAAVIADQLPRKASPMSIMPIFPMGGAYHDPSDDDTAFGGSRASKWLVNIAAITPDRDLLAVDRTWVRGFWEALQPYASGSGSYVNFIADTGDETQVRDSYGAAKYDRLARIKAQYDPGNLFHRNANIKPAVRRS